jgi:hypothetical protein
LGIVQIAAEKRNWPPAGTAGIAGARALEHDAIRKNRIML